ncbi:hypothetical protein QQ045_013518 [Rhodiola kirilowii]
MAALAQPQNEAELQGKHFYTMLQTLFEIDIKYVLRLSLWGEELTIHKVFQNRIDALRELQLLRLIMHENVIVLKDVMLPANKSFKDADRRSHFLLILQVFHFPDEFPYSLMECLISHLGKWNIVLTRYFS